MDIRQSPNYAKFMESIGWIVEKAGNTNIFIRRIGPTSVIKIQRPRYLDVTDIDRIARKYRALLVKIEPDNGLLTTDHRLQQDGFERDQWPLLPTKTLIIELDQISLDTLPKDTRYEIRKAQSNNLTIEQSDNIELFYKLLRETMRIGGWSVPIRKEVTTLFLNFQPDNSQILFTHHPDTPNTPIAGCPLTWHEDTAHYMYAATTKEGRKLGAAYLTLWEAINFCKKKKLKYLDLEGIFDERYPKQTKNWQGFTRFKMGWGGEIVEYPGSFTKYYNPIIRLLFRFT